MPTRTSSGWLYEVGWLLIVHVHAREDLEVLK
jgi:hypothetical protein